MSEVVSGQLAQRSLAAVKWSYLGVIARVCAQLCAQIALARLLGPESFGLFAAVLLVLGVGSLLVESGVGPTLIQSKTLQDDHRAAASGAVLINAFLISSLVVLTAEPLARFFFEPELARLLRWIWPAFFLHALSITPMALLRRDLDFKSIQLIQVFGYVIGFLGVGVSAAWLGAGVWSFVAAWLTQGLVVAILANVRHPCMPRVSSRASGFWMHPFGVRVLATNLVNWFIENIDNLIVGRFFGAVALGFYSVSYNFVRNPTNHLVTSLQAVLFPASALAQDDDARLARGYLTAIAGVALVSFPIFFSVATLSQTIVVAVFGDQWSKSVDVLIPLALAMPLHALMAIAGPVLWGKGVSGLELKVQLVTAALLSIALFLASQQSVEIVGWAVFLIYGLRFVFMSFALSKSIGLALSEILRVTYSSVILAGIVSGGALFFDRFFMDLYPVLRVFLDIAFCGLISVFLVVGAPRFFLACELRALLSRLLSGRSSMLDRFVIRRF